MRDDAALELMDTVYTEPNPPNSYVLRLMQGLDVETLVPQLVFGADP